MDKWVLMRRVRCARRREHGVDVNTMHGVNTSASGKKRQRRNEGTHFGCTEVREWSLRDERGNNRGEKEEMALQELDRLLWSGQIRMIAIVRCRT